MTWDSITAPAPEAAPKSDYDRNRRLAREIQFQYPKLMGFFVFGFSAAGAGAGGAAGAGVAAGRGGAPW